MHSSKRARSEMPGLCPTACEGPSAEGAPGLGGFFADQDRRRKNNGPAPGPAPQCHACRTPQPELTDCTHCLKSTCGECLAGCTICLCACCKWCISQRFSAQDQHTLCPECNIRHVSDQDLPPPFLQDQQQQQQQQQLSAQEPVDPARQPGIAAFLGVAAPRRPMPAPPRQHPYPAVPISETEGNAPATGKSHRTTRITHYFR
ncbi:hypothetical protein H696_02198 [Fonticula alba]|uniref:Uncharacterized protein n=1 Tax=Fonticula alba TaxID=691883 RepID=A0A058ZBF2_FONAL|nr:hypothetical protein H696_02198 [Fonticula alba]KCV71248.1 hypothetical protein H696_02198 [Fonticula alba]|eukprot:XP_009494371.1 hypothetical protein H696_02198 [Fonticula alba]